MKVLCACNGGVVRSVTLAAILKYWFDVDALAVSLDKNRGNTLVMLCEWADVVAVVEPWMMREFLPCIHKVKVVPIGPDVWGMSNHPDLIAEIMRHDLPEILGVDQEVWDRRGAHLNKWLEHKKKLVKAESE